MLINVTSCLDCPFMEMSSNHFGRFSNFFAVCKLSKRKLADGTKLPGVEIKNLKSPPKLCPLKTLPNSIEVTYVG
jgi:hypothetical protein